MAANIDTNKQPGIITQEIFMTKCFFERKPIDFDTLHVECTLSYAKAVNNEGVGTGFLSLVTKGTPREEAFSDLEVFTAEIDFIGYFTEGSDPNIPMDVFLDSFAQGHLLSYIREVLSNATLKAGLPPIILPPINVAGLVSAEFGGDFRKKDNQNVFIDFAKKD